MPYTDPVRNRENARRWQAQRRDEMRAIIRKAKERPCLDCGIQYPYYVMQFDHVRGTKVAGISKIVQQPSKHNMAVLVKEMAKCEVVCANCHALRHGGTGVRRIGDALGCGPS